jgi:hypothetical protein
MTSGHGAHGGDAPHGADLLSRLLELWDRPPPEGDGAVAAFARVYADPFLLNGVETTVEALVARARMLHAAFEGIRIDEILSRVDAPGKLVIVFRQQGRHVGPLPTPLGTIPATGRTFDTQTIDVLTAVDGRITEVWVVADELGRLMQLGAIKPSDAAGRRPVRTSRGSRWRPVRRRRRG